MTRRAIPARTIIKALLKNYGVMTAAAEELGMDRSQIWRRAKNNPKIAQAVEDGRDRIVDLAETQLTKNMKSGDSRLIKYTLSSARGKKRGYGETKDVNLNQTGEITINIIGVEPEKKEKD